MVEELYQMYTGEERSFNILEHDHCVVLRVTPYTWELFTKTENTHTSVYRESYGFKHLDKLVMDIKGLSILCNPRRDVLISIWYNVAGEWLKRL